MSHPRYNPYASGTQRSNQGQHRVSSVQPERDLRRDIPGYGPGSSFNPPPASSATPANHGGNIPSLLDLPVIYRPEQARARVNKATERDGDLHVSRAREEVRCLDRPAQPIDQSTRFSHTQSDEILSSGTGTTSYPMSSTSASAGRRHAEGSGDYNYPAPVKPAAHAETAPHKHTSESAANILLNFGLEREDLEFLISYPEEQITPDNLPFLLRQIRTQKANRAMTAVESEPFPQPQPSRVVSERDMLISSGGSPAVLQPNKVIDYGHTSKYFGGVLDAIGRTSGRSADSGGSDISLFLNEQRSSSDSQEQLKTETEIRSIPMFLSRFQTGSVTTDRSSYTSALRSVAPESSDPVQQFQTQPDQTSKPIFRSFSIPKKEPDRKVLTSEALKLFPLKAPETKPQLTLKSQQSSKVLDNAYQGRRGHVVIDKVYTSAAKDEKATRGQDSRFSEQRIKLPEETQLMQKTQKQQPQMQHVQKQQEQLVQMQHVQKQQEQLVQMQHLQKQQEQLAQMQHLQKQQEQLAQMQPTQKQPAQMQHLQKQQEQLAQMQHVQKQQEQLAQEQLAQMQHLQKQQEQLAQMQPAQKQPPQTQPAQTENARTQQPQKQPVSQLGKPTVYPTVKPSYSQPMVNPPASLQPSPNTWSSAYPILVKVPGPQKQPTEAMMYDYAAATPTVFPHTCSLCYKECINMKDWISHQNSPLHLNSCKYLRTLYPQWSGEIVLEPCDAVKDATPSTSASGQTSKKREEKTSAGSRSRSPSPRRRHRPDSSRGKRSLSRSSRDSSYGRSRSRDRSRSRSYERSRKRERRSSSRRSSERRSSPRRRGDKRSSPRRSKERRSSPRRRRADRRSSPRRRDERRSSLRRSRDRRSSSESSSERRSSSADRLVKKVLEKSDVKSLSRPSDVEAVVKTLFAEIAKLKSASSSSSTKRGKTSKSAPSAERKSSTSAASSSSSASKEKKTTSSRGSKASTKTREEDTKPKTTPQQVLTKDKTAAEGSTKETGARVSVSEATKVSIQQVSKKPRSEPTHVSEVTVKVESASSSQEPKTPVDNLAETKGRDKKEARSKPKPKAERVSAEARQAAGAEPMELGETGGDVVETCAEGKETNVEAVSDKPSESQPPTSKDETGPPTVQTADEASSQVPEPESTEPESTEQSVASGLDTKMEASRSPSPAEEGEKNTKDPASAEKNHRDPTSASVEPAAGTVSEKPAAAGRRSSAAVRTLTLGEMVEEHFHPDKIKCLSKESAMSKESCRTLLISNLPKFHEGCYTEDDVAAVFVPFGLTSWSEEIYVVPQARVAFVVMPSPLSIHRVLAARPDSIALKKNRLSLQVLGPKDNQSLKDPRMEHDGHKTVYIRNISPSEARDLREALRKIGSVSNYLPLLNKVFIEFESDWGADRLGMWCSLLKQAPSYIVVRLKEPFSTCRAQTPEHPEKAIPHSKDAAAWATTPSQKHGVPRGSCSPFWITMSTSPFVFPTTSPWFSIPEYQTVRGYDDIKNDNSRGSMFLTLMLTGLPEGGYRQEDVYRLVRPYFPQILDSLYYNVIVLTLQRRAFVHFCDWTSCCNFVRDHIREPVSVRGSVLKIHFVLEYMYPEPREELMYTTLMKWSNSSVPDPQSLAERLLCVDIAQTSVYLIKTVMKTVASIAKFVSFLPLANRICVEMADSSGAAQVLEKFMVFTPKAQCERLMFLKSSKKHIEASAEPAGDVPMEDVEKLGAEMAADSTSAPKVDEDVDAADGDTVPAASTSLPRSNETTTEHPPIDQDTIKAVLAAVRQHRLAQERTQRGETESSLRSQNQDEATDVVLTSDDQPLNLRDFVTVDEVGDDVEETNPAHEASRGQRDAKKRKRSNKPSKATEQETSEILIIDNKTTMDQNTEEEDASKEVDSVTDQPTTTESESDNKKPDVTSRRDDRSSKRSGLRTRASKSEEKVKSPEKQDRVVKRSEAPRDSTARLPQRDQDPEEEKVSEMVHSTEELVQEAAATERTDRRRSGRGKKEDKVTLNLTEASEKPDEDEEASYEILDSVEDETVTEEPVVMTRSTRGRRGRTTQKDQTKKEDTPTRSRRTPVRETQEKPLEMEKEASSKENSPTKKKDITVREEIDEEATYEILDSVEDEGDKDASEKEADDEKVSSPILDSVKDEMVEDQPPTEESLKDKEEEPVHQIVDSLEDDRVKEELTTEESKDETCPKEEEAAVQEDATTCSTVVLEASEKVVAEDLESGNEPSAAEESGLDKKERSLRTDIKEEDTSTTNSHGDAATPVEEKNQQSSGESDTTAVKSALLNLDEVRDEKDDYSEDTVEAEGLRERQAAAKEQEGKTRETDGREQEVVDSTELVTLDEVGADEAGEETVEIRAAELQGLVTLDEIVDADEGEVEQSSLEPHPPIKEDQAVETLDEAGDDEEGNTEEAEKTTRPVKRRINEDTEETLVTVDEVEEEEKKETPRTRGRPKKRSRKTPVRKSARGKKVVEQAESGSDAPPPTSLDASSSLDKDPSMLSSDSQQEIQKASLEGAGHSDIDAASAGQDLQPEAPENQRLEGEEATEASSVPSKRKREPVGPEAKRSRSLSPSVSTDIKLPPFSPSNPLGPEFLVPKLGYFCNLCHVFCVHESSARDTHCSSQTHYDNLQACPPKRKSSRFSNLRDADGGQSYNLKVKDDNEVKVRNQKKRRQTTGDRETCPRLIRAVSGAGLTASAVRASLLPC
ncbi:unnamed protein product [Pleuronectes platessa]|uniref:Matrin-type domain-containing protein n=1 Tax=Pleuronectes platessa TaxID=8262 RepID=A0A9N7TRV9_PLEPL|nr:unnamed protein product [Pleuronectes platessa]